jgi:hypothetical protein
VFDNRREIDMKRQIVAISAIAFAMIQVPASAADNGAVFGGMVSNSSAYLQLAGSDDRQDRRQERGRSDERQDKRDCRQEEGMVGKDKRDCKQEEVRDGVRGHQG